MSFLGAACNFTSGSERERERARALTHSIGCPYEQAYVHLIYMHTSPEAANSPVKVIKQCSYEINTAEKKKKGFLCIIDWAVGKKDS